MTLPVSKEDAELAILKRFITAYKKRFNVELTNIIHRDRPDFEVTNPISNEQIGIEITGTYQNEREAKIQYGVLMDWERFQGSSEDILNSLNNRLSDKATKSIEYNFDGRMILAIWLGSLVFNQKFDVDFIRNAIIIPENEFSEIWLIIRDNVDYSPELYPLQV